MVGIRSYHFNLLPPTSCSSPRPLVHLCSLSLSLIMALRISTRQIVKPWTMASASPELPSSPSRQILPVTFRRRFHFTQSFRHDHRASAEEFSSHRDKLARTEPTTRVEYSRVSKLPASVAPQGRGGRHFKRTLASFSLEGRVGVVTGGARGLGLVMSQALVISGASVAIVDLNSMFTSLTYCHKSDLKI